MNLFDKKGGYYNMKNTGDTRTHENQPFNSLNSSNEFVYNKLGYIGRVREFGDRSNPCLGRLLVFPRSSRHVRNH